jgi:hypothetical protein
VRHRHIDQQQPGREEPEQAENFMRSAKAPQISAGVMMAKVIWNTMNRLSGMVPVRLSAARPLRKRRLASPRKAPCPEKAKE